MTYQSIRSLGRFMLAACAVSLGAGSMGAQTPASTTPATAGSNPSKVDVFLGYSYFAAHGSVKPAGIQYSSINYGAMGSVAYYFNRYFGGEVIYSNHPDGKNDGFSGASGGLIVRYPAEGFTVFGHGLVGAGRLGGPNDDNPASFEHEPYRWGPALTAGGGMDYDLPFMDHRFGLRVFQADYRWVHTNYGPPTTIPTAGVLGGRTNLSAIELSTGILLHFGHVIPPPPVTYACTAAPASGYPGDPITVTGTAGNLNPKKTATYSWTSTGGTISGTSSTATISTATAAPGTYTVTGHVTEGAKPGQSADCTAQFTINAFQPPTISCSANPTSVNPGGSATITATASSPQNRPLTYSYTSTAGNVSGNGATATLSTTGAAPGSITVTCNVADDKGNTQSATTMVNVIAPPPPPQPTVAAPTTSNLCTVAFGRDKARPARVDNEAKACLDEVALALQRSSDAKLALVGNGNARENNAKAGRRGTVAAQRAVNTKDYLVSEKGIDASRINVYTGTGDEQTVTTTLIPTGANMNTAGATPVPETVKAAPRARPRTSRKAK
jgi:outer membrane protein OmpA-like peptidoglycan-associated protein